MATDIFSRTAERWLSSIRGVRVELDSSGCHLHIDFGACTPPPAWIAQIRIVLIEEESGCEIGCHAERVNAQVRPVSVTAMADDGSDLVFRFGNGIFIRADSVILAYEDAERRLPNASSRSRFLARESGGRGDEDGLLIVL